MRTAITIARTHAGEWKMLSTPAEDLREQRAAFYELRAAKFHSEFALVQYQENDGAALTARLLTPDAHEAREKQNAADHAAYLESQKPKENPASKNSGLPKPEPTPAEKRQAELIAMNKGDLLAIVEKLKAEGKTIVVEKTTKSGLANAILKTEGFTITAPETAE